MATEEQIAKINAWLQEHDVRAVCPACGTNNWSTGQIIQSPVFTPGKGLAIGGPGVPMIQLVCGHCAYIMLFAAVPILGLNQ